MVAGLLQAINTSVPAFQLKLVRLRTTLMIQSERANLFRTKILAAVASAVFALLALLVNYVSHELGMND